MGRSCVARCFGGRKSPGRPGAGRLRGDAKGLCSTVSGADLQRRSSHQITKRERGSAWLTVQ
jgi:hypothetical protein